MAGAQPGVLATLYPHRPRHEPRCQGVGLSVQPQRRQTWGMKPSGCSLALAPQPQGPSPPCCWHRPLLFRHRPSCLVFPVGAVSGLVASRAAQQPGLVLCVSDGRAFIFLEISFSRPGAPWSGPSFPGAATTLYHEERGLTRWRCIVSQFWTLEG